MSEGLDAALILSDVGEKPSKQYRTSPYTVLQYSDLPYAQRRAVDAACDMAAGLTYTQHADESSPQPYTIGRRTLAPAPSKRCPTGTLSTTSITTGSMITAAVHPAPSIALHTLNTPERIDHDEAHPDNLLTSAVAEQCPADHALPFAALTEAVDVAATPTQAAPSEALAHDGTVYETTNYDLFHLLPENRDVVPSHVRKLVGMIQQKNLLHLKPLDVTPDLGVIDGQHRLAAARELGLPIFYKVGEQLDDTDITTLNTASKNWVGSDWLKYWTVKRKPAYVALTDFMQRHPRISFSNAKIMLSGQAGGGTKFDVFRAGRWDGADDEDVTKAEQVAELVECIMAEVPTFKQPTHTGFVAALYYCVAEVQGFDAKELMRKIRQQPRSLVPCAGHKQWLKMLEDLYNYRNTADNRIRFE